MPKDKIGVHGTDKETGRGNGFRKTESQITKESFLKGAKPIKVRLQVCDELGAMLQEQIVVAFPKDFSSGSFGFHANDKVTIEIGGLPIKFQSNILLTVVGSKPKESS